MGSLTIALNLLLALALGAIIGLERESEQEYQSDHEKFELGKIGGIRTFSLMALLGGLAGIVFSFEYAALAYIISIIFFILVCAYYVIGSWFVKSLGLTTEIAAIFTFLIGFLSTSQIIPAQVVIALAIIIALILSLKEKARKFALGIRSSEVNALLLFAILAVVVLPFLPNQSFSISDVPFFANILKAYGVGSSNILSIELINPFRLWFIVVLVTGIELLGYVFGKIAGKKRGKFFASVAGGFVSSTATTQALAVQSKKDGKSYNSLAAAALFANMASFFQIFVLIAPLNSRLLVRLTPILAVIIITAFVCGMWLWKRSKNTEATILVQEATEDVVSQEKVFSLGPALLFAVLVVVVGLITKIALVVFGNSGFFISAMISSLVGLDAIIVTLAQTAGGVITLNTAVLTFILVNAVNLAGKSLFVFLQGKRDFSLRFFACSSVVVIASVLVYFLI